MESNWRYEVALRGMVASNWLLAARYVFDNGTRPRWAVKVDDNVFGELWEAFDEQSLPQRVVNVQLFGKFPYGQFVRPDHG